MREDTPLPEREQELLLPPIDAPARPNGARESFRGIQRLAPTSDPAAVSTAAAPAIDAPGPAAAAPSATTGTTTRRDAFEAELLRAWLGTRLEHDRSLLTLGTGGVGLMIGLVKLARPVGSIAFGFHLVAFVAFLVTTLSSLLIFRLNSTYLEGVAKGSGGSRSRVVAILDVAASSSFFLGVTAAACIGFERLAGP
jgi:hypothetical protein